MGKLKSFVVGTLLGVGGTYFGLQYHVLQAEEGFLVVPRSPQQRIQDAYADVRDWDAASWAARPRLGLAVTEYGRGDLIAEGVRSEVFDELRETFPPLGQSLGRQSGETSHGWEPASTSRSPAPTVRRPAADAGQASTSPAESAPARRGFLPLADLFGLGRKPAPSDTPSITPGRVPPVLPAGVTVPRQVEILPSPGHFESLGDPGGVELGPNAPIPGSNRKVDRRRSDAGWVPLTVNSF
jgi:hypothetical protein